jgi:hypothetical protein
MKHVGRLLAVGAFSGAWWFITRSPMVGLVTLGVGTVQVIQERDAPRMRFEGVILTSLVIAVANLYMERM